MEFDNLTDEQKAKALACKTPEDLFALAKEEGVELTDEQLDAVAGGRAWYDCPGYCPDNNWDGTGGHM